MFTKQAFFSPVHPLTLASLSVKSIKVRCVQVPKPKHIQTRCYQLIGCPANLWSPQQTAVTDTMIKVTGHTYPSLQQICDLFNTAKKQTVFHPIDELFAGERVIFVDHLMLMIDPSVNTSIEKFHIIQSAKRQACLNTNQMTVVILTHQSDIHSEQVFDRIYNECDDSTLVTALDLSQKIEVACFVQFF